jgi:hypothetical protein
MDTEIVIKVYTSILLKIQSSLQQNSMFFWKKIKTTK